MGKRLNTHLTGSRSLSIIEGVVRGQAAVEIRPVDHPAIERMRLAFRLGWRCKGREAFGGKRSLAGSGPAGEIPSAGASMPTTEALSLRHHAASFAALSAERFSR